MCFFVSGERVIPSSPWAWTSRQLPKQESVRLRLSTWTEDRGRVEAPMSLVAAFNHVHVPAYHCRWVNFGSLAKACHGNFIYSSFLLFMEQEGAHDKYYYSVIKNRSAPHFLQPPAIDKEPEWNAKMYANQRRDEMARTWKHIFGQHFRTKYRCVGVYNHFPLEDFSHTKGNGLVSAQEHISVKLKTDK